MSSVNNNSDSNNSNTTDSNSNRTGFAKIRRRIDRELDNSEYRRRYLPRKRDFTTPEEFNCSRSFSRMTWLHILSLVIVICLFFVVNRTVQYLMYVLLCAMWLYGLIVGRQSLNCYEHSTSEDDMDATE